MAEYFLDVSAVGAEYQAYADTPASWAVPQDGNGKAGPGHAAAVAIATIDVAGCSASGTGMIGVLGVTVSSTLNASGAALATAIAAAINASSTAVSAIHSANLLPLNRLVFARVNPGLATQVQIMLRIAGTDWNGMPPTQANITPAATIGAFSGGADGPFAYLLNVGGAVFGRAQMAYGMFRAAAPGVSEPTFADCIHVRTARGGVGLLVALVGSPGFSWATSRSFLFDDGTVWVGEPTAGQLTLRLLNNYNGSGTSGGASAGGSRLSFESRSFGNFKVEIGSIGNASNTTTFFSSSHDTFFSFRNSICERVSNAIGGGSLLASSVIANVDLSGSLYRNAGNINPAYQAISVSAGSAHFRLNGFSVEYVAAAAPIPEFINWKPNNAAGSTFEWIGGKVYDTNGIYSCANPLLTASPSVPMDLVIDGVAGITNPSIAPAISTRSHVRLWWNQTEGVTRGFRLNTGRYSVDWRGDGTFPHCGARNLQGEYWSHRLTWHAGTSFAAPATPLRFAHFFREAAAVKTFTVELYVPDSITVYGDELEFSISYLDASNVWRTESAGAPALMQLASRAPAIAASAMVWSPNGVAGHSARKLSITTGHPVAQNTEVLGRLTLVSERASAAAIYVSPTLTVSA
jgi:hypothetical protein